MERGELTEESNEGTLAEGVVDVGVEGCERLEMAIHTKGQGYIPRVGNSLLRCLTQAAYDDVSHDLYASLHKQ